LLDAVLSPEERESGFSRHDLDQTPLAAVLDDARSMSLFASQRVIWAGSAEAALPRGKASEEEESGAGALAAYLSSPTPGTVLVIEASRYHFDGEDKAKLERVQQFYSAVPAQVEFRAFSPEAARALTQKLVKDAGVQLGLAELALLIEATAGDVARLAVEIEKLRLFAGARKVTAEDIAALVPDARSSTIFSLVAALGKGDRARALQTLDTLTREGAVPDGAGGARGEFAERFADSGALQPVRRANLAGAGAADRADRSGVFEGPAGKRGGEVIRRGSGAAGCPAGRPHRNGRDDSGADCLNAALTPSLRFCGGAR
jgi:DNA polymerase III delta subunit